MKLKSKAVEWAVREMWAKLASRAAKRAAYQVECGSYDSAVDTMACVEKWLGKAGAMATKWHFKAPQ